VAEEIKTVGVPCCQCKRERGKSAKPWRTCIKCSGVVCLMCCPSHNANPKCNKCWQEDWQREWDEKEKIRKSTLVTCNGCEENYLPDDMKKHVTPAICLACDKIVSHYLGVEAAYKRKKNAKPGLVEVQFGIATPTEDGGKGYAYRDPGLNLKLGDIVTLPPTWLDTEINGKYETHEGTVVSTYSDYSGDRISTIRGLVRRAS
jgi:hypothetical protein